VDRRGFAELYAEHAAFVWRASVWLGVPTAHLDDAVQEVFLVAHRRLPDFEAKSSMRTWLFGIARRIAFRFRRTQSRAQRKAEALVGTGRAEMDLEHWYAHREASHRVLRFIEDLDADQRIAFVLSDVEGFTRPELGAALGLNENPAWARVRSARAKLARTFGANEPLDTLLAGTAQATAPSADRKSALWLALVPKLGASATISKAASWAAAIALLAAAAGGTAIATSRADTPPVADSAPSAEPSSIAPARVEAPAIASTRSPPALPRESPASAPIAGRANEPAPSGSPASASRAQPPPSEVVDVVSERELALVLAARAALQRNAPADALVELDRLAAEFPRSRHAEERDALRIVASCALGRSATDAIARFEQAHPDSPLSARIAGACGSTESAGAGD
jgi:RNA polymerase sigma factor (sigma-70 family)